MRRNRADARGTPAGPTHAEPGEDEGEDSAKWPPYRDAVARLGSAAQIARLTARAEQAAYAVATRRGEEYFRLPIGSLARLIEEFEQGNVAMRAERVRLLFQMLGSTCPGTLEIHEDGRPGECTEDACSGGFHLDTDSCRYGEYWCVDCEERIEFEADEDDPEWSDALESPMARRNGTDG